MTLSFYTNEIEIRRKDFFETFPDGREVQSSLAIVNGIGSITVGGDDSISLDFDIVYIHTGLHFGILRG